MQNKMRIDRGKLSPDNFQGNFLLSLEWNIFLWKWCQAELCWRECFLLTFVVANFHVTFWLPWTMMCQCKKTWQHCTSVQVLLHFCCSSDVKGPEGSPSSITINKRLFAPCFLCNHANTFSIFSAIEEMLVWSIRNMVNVSFNLAVIVLFGDHHKGHLFE